MPRYTRIPVIPESYDNKQRAVCKELLVNYDTGDIYIVSKDDPSVLIDVTNKIKESIKNIEGANIEVTIEGIGTINLQELMKQMNETAKSSLKAIPTGDSIKYVTDKAVLDNKSLEINHKANKIQIKGFKEADDNTMLVKRDGIAKWVPVITTDNTGSSDEPTTPGITGGNSTPINPDDGLSSKCHILDPSDHKLYLLSSKRQKTIMPTSYFKVILPTPMDERTDIEWLLITDEKNTPDVSFPTNLFWEELFDQLSPSTMHAFKFSTWDGGRTWAASFRKYNNNAVHTVITKEYLETNYYNKTEINELLSWEDNEGDNNESDPLE